MAVTATVLPAGFDLAPGLLDPEAMDEEQMEQESGQLWDAAPTPAAPQGDASVQRMQQFFFGKGDGAPKPETPPPEHKKSALSWLFGSLGE